MRRHIITLIAVLVISTSPVVAAVGDTSPSQTTTKSTSDITINTDGEINTQRQIDNILYVGGEFVQLGIDQSELVQVSHLAEIDLADRSLTEWRPSPNQEVNAIFTDGNLLYIGGNFTHISNVAKSYLAVFDKETKELQTFDFIPNAPVYALASDAEQLYIGGEFTEINGSPHQYIVAINKADNAIVNWQPDVVAPVRNIILEDETIKIITSETPYASEQKSIIIDRATLSLNNPTNESELIIDREKLGFEIPTLADILTFVIRMFFVIAGIAALFYLLLGAFAWITSGGDKDSIGTARDKIQAAIVGLLMTVVALAIVWTLEQVIFRQRVCLGLSCPLTIPVLLEPIEGGEDL